MTIVAIIEIFFSLVILIILTSILWEAYERTQEEWELDQMDYSEYHDEPTKERNEE